MNKEYTVSNGRLEGPIGSWSIKNISAVFKRQGGKLSFKKYAIMLAGVTAAGSAVLGPFGSIILFGGSVGYYLHNTMNVYIVVDGTEVELHSALYFMGVWGEEDANKQCDALVELISPHIS